jgi:hypothetical protein
MKGTDDLSDFFMESDSNESESQDGELYER